MFLLQFGSFFLDLSVLDVVSVTQPIFRENENKTSFRKLAEDGLGKFYTRIRDGKPSNGGENTPVLELSPMGTWICQNIRTETYES